MGFARTIIRKAGTLIGVRRTINLIEGTNVTLTIADDSVNDRVNVTIDASGGGGGSSPDLVITKYEPALDQTITDGYSAYYSGYYEIADTKFLEIGNGSTLEIG
jgi:hypothetical protein